MNSPTVILESKHIEPCYTIASGKVQIQSPCIKSNPMTVNYDFLNSKTQETGPIHRVNWLLGSLLATPKGDLNIRFHCI